ncbi:hypothetical protein [Alsobacter sp. R-9]
MAQKTGRTHRLGPEASMVIDRTARHVLAIVSAEPQVPLDRVLVLLARRAAPDVRPEAKSRDRRASRMR